MEGNSQSSGLLHWLRVVTVGRNPRWTFVRLVILIVATIIIFKFCLLPIRITGSSMEPTYHDHGINVINRLAYRSHPPQRGDVVGIRFRAGPHVILMKRIVGLPGETISFSHGHVCVNGTPLDEPYLKFPSNWEFDVGQLGPNEYYFVGDNRTMPHEDHEQGRAEPSRILGKVIFAHNL